jgi:fatty-acyl-CoA synthase
MSSIGVEAGDRVAVLMPNLPELLELHFAIPGSGAVLVPLNTRLTVAEYTYVIDHCEARCLITTPSLRGVAQAIAANTKAALRIIEIGPDSTYEQLAESEGSGALHVPDENALFSINYTSGTTGVPKGVMYTHRGCYLHALGVLAESRLDAASVYLWTLPMFHCHGWAYPWAVTAAGARHECLNGLDPDIVWRLIRDRGVTHFCAAPTVVSMLVGLEESPLDQRVSVFVGGAPPAPALFERARALGLDLRHLYGLTETYGPIAACIWQPEWDTLASDRQNDLRARQGVPTVVSEPLRVVDEQMVDVPADSHTMGEIVVRGNNVTIGYYRDPAATTDAFRGGWFHTGDLGVMHPDGYVQIRDRMKDIIISGGENVSTVEVESALAAHPSVAETAVIGVPDEHWGEVVKAYVVLRAGTTLRAEELRAFARQRLAGYKVPRAVAFVAELPKTSTGKVTKYALREAASRLDAAVPLLAHPREANRKESIE